MGHITVVGPSMNIVRTRMKLIMDGNNQGESIGPGSKYLSTSSNISAKDLFISSGDDNSGSFFSVSLIVTFSSFIVEAYSFPILG